MSFIAVTTYPRRSRREMISPTRLRETPSGLTSTSVVSKAIAPPNTANRRGLPLAGADEPNPKHHEMGSEHPYAAVAHELQGTAFASIRYVDVTASTNDDAAALLGNPAAFGTSIVAERQTRGAGRKGRAWLAQPGSALLFTTILPRSIPATHLWIVPFGVAIAVRRALEVNGVRTTLHWPNDVLLGERKLAGILCVARVVGDRAWVGTGVGINVHRLPGADAGIAP